MGRSCSVALLLAGSALVLLAASCAAQTEGPSQDDADSSAMPSGSTEAPSGPEHGSKRHEERGSSSPSRPRGDSSRQERAGKRVLELGSRGARVARLQRSLVDLGYWVGPTDGAFSDLTQQAVFAFQAVAGITRDGDVGPQTRSALQRAIRPKPRSTKGDLIEVDEGRQVLFVVRRGRVKWTFHVSTGSNETYRRRGGKAALANTPNGRWKMIYEYKEGWHKSPLGRLWRPKYFHPTGIAIHGFSSVPPYPASHGCVRVTIPAMNLIWREQLASKGSRVWVY
jgi:Putative peptidoglycan binding domain/L,D-transpeptidase catalytic domain